VLSTNCGFDAFPSGALAMIARGLLCGGLALVFLFASERAQAWNNTGHKTVALIACLDLKDSQKDAIYKLLQNHPHTKIVSRHNLNFFADGLPPQVSPRDWAILQAATWPDFVRPPKFPMLSDAKIQADEVFKYHRRDAHFFDIPFINPGFKPALPKPKELDILKSA
jgi:hypothetical protein